MGARRKFSAEYKREAVAMLESPGVTVSQIAADLGIGATVLGRWCRELRQEPKQAFVGHGVIPAVTTPAHTGLKVMRMAETPPRIAAKL